MKITAKQIQFLLLTFQESLNIKGNFTMTFDLRLAVFKDIMDQQSDEIIEIK